MASEASEAREDPRAGGQGAAIIIKKVAKGGHGHHGGAWKVAYADMVTALMALFIVLWILAQNDEVVRNVAGYFKDPVGFVDGGMPQPVEVIDEKHVEPVVPRDGGDGGVEGAADMERRWRDAAAQIRKVLLEVPSFAKYGDQVELSLADEGLRITLVESAETPLFEVGGTALHPESEALLKAITVSLAELPNKILVEGHTDSRPFGNSSDVTNWELSTGRAHTARRVMEATGIAPERMLAVRGFADRRLYNPLDSEDSRNRRVAITLLSEKAAEAHLELVDEVVLP